MWGPLTSVFGFLGLVAPSRALLRSDAVADVANALVRSTLFNVVTQEQLHRVNFLPFLCNSVDHTGARRVFTLTLALCGFSLSRFCNYSLKCARQPRTSV